MGSDDRRAFDAHMMAIALQMARRGLGTTAPNPSVGAVIADETTGEVIARAVTQQGGRPHAETEALKAAGLRARGATMYVTLEPCSHHGKTPPCAGAVVVAGLRRVVVATADPDPRVAGRGLNLLRTAGIDVERGLLMDEARQVSRGHILRVTERRPLVQLKLAVDADGNIARGEAGAPRWVTGEAARARGHLLRARADAILVGRQTALDDDPDLTCRLPGLKDLSPVRVVLATTMDGLENSRLIKTADRVPVWIVTAQSDAQPLAWPGVKIIAVASVAGRLWLPAVMEALVSEGITRLLVEGGPTIWRAFADAGLSDEVYLFQAGPAAAAAKAEVVLARWLGPAPLELIEQSWVGADTLTHWRRATSHYNPPGKEGP